MPRISFPSILLLFFGGVLAALVAGFGCLGVGASRFTSELVSAFVNDGYWIAGYQVLAHERDWVGLSDRFARVPGRALLQAAGAALVLMATFLSVAAILHGFGVQFKEIETLNLLNGGPRTLPLVSLLIVFFAPAAEELLWRGLLLDWLRQRLTNAPAILISGLVFGLLHGISIHSGTIGWLQFGYRVILGVASGVFAVRYRSLRPSFVLHAVNNCVVVIAASQLK
jgi:membrane protease YdiL (CAAX protease family)